jgi:hypothetical protein
MAEELEKKRIKHPAVDFEVDAVNEFLIEQWAHGFRVHLIIDENGFLTDEPRFYNGLKVPVDLGTPEHPTSPPPSFIGTRLLLEYQVNEPPPEMLTLHTLAVTKGCRLLNGIWY